MNKLNMNFWKNSLALLIVAVVLIIIGAISLGRSSQYKDNRLLNNLNAKENIAVLSDENLQLKQQLDELKQENQKNNQQIQELTKKLQETEKFLTVPNLIEEKDYTQAKEIMQSVDVTKLPEQLKNDYNKYNEQIIKKENKK